MANELTPREEMATRLACAMIMSPAQADPVHRMTRRQIATESADLAAEIIDMSEYNFKKAREAGRSV